MAKVVVRPVVARLRRVLDKLGDGGITIAKTLTGRRLHRWNRKGDMQPMILEILHEPAHPSNRPEHVRNLDYYGNLFRCTANGLGLSEEELDDLIKMVDEEEFDERVPTAVAAVEYIIETEESRRARRRSRKSNNRAA